MKVSQAEAMSSGPRSVFSGGAHFPLILRNYQRRLDDRSSDWLWVESNNVAWSYSFLALDTSRNHGIALQITGLASRQSIKY